MDDFWEEIEKKDYLSLKVDARSVILIDSTFSTHELNDMISIFKKKVPEIFEKEIELSYEERLDESEWTKGYFSRLVFWFQQNFALSRIPYIKKVGRAVYK